MFHNFDTENPYTVKKPSEKNARSFSFRTIGEKGFDNAYVAKVKKNRAKAKKARQQRKNNR